VGSGQPKVDQPLAEKWEVTKSEMKVKTEIKDDILIVTINRPEVKNAIDRETADLLYSAFSDFDQNDDLKVAILSGTDGVFCSGADLKTLAGDLDAAPQLDIEGNAPLGISRMILNKPVIAAVEGYAVAGGLELALWCDMRVASEDATFGVYCRRFGVPLVDGGTIRLPRLIGQSHAMDMILTGRGVKGEEAKSMGLVNRLVPNGSALNSAIKLAAQISKFPQSCMRNDRLSAIEQWSMSMEAALINETKRGIETLNSGETMAGAKRFVKGDY